MIKYDKYIFMDKLIVNFDIISFNRKILKPIVIEINNTLKKFSFLWNLLVTPTITKDNTTKNIGLSISEK